ncbi:MAG TPA: hydrogen peroxide-inducible genes activator [Stellaceae bacterium]|nr:hydrogen peroxide-inducible genes activator [Stellaceae bacterium]
MITLPTLRQLRHLVALADHGHFGRAAAAAAITQSTLSASIKELETVLEASLVDRTRRQVVLTPLGKQTVERARRILADTEALALAARAEREPLTGTLRMGVIPTIGPYLLPAVLPGLRHSYRGLQLYLVEDLTPRLIEQLHAGQLDMVMLALPYDCGNVESATLFDDRFLLALPPDHPLAKERRIDPERLRSEEVLLLRDGHCLREHALSVCHLADRRRSEAFEATSLPTLVQMVDNGLGITLLPELAVDAGLLRGTSLVTRPLASEEPGREIALVWRRGTGRREEFLLLAKELAARAKKVRHEPQRHPR